MLFRKIILLYFFVAIAFNVFAQQTEIAKKRFPVVSLNYENGLTDNATSSIITDDLGYTWIANFTALQRFNGYKLETVNPVVGTDTFHINYPVILFGLQDGNILIVIKNGLVEYNIHTDKFSLLVTLDATPAFHFSVLPLKETSEGIWCVQKNKGVVLYDKKGKLKRSFSFFNTGILDNFLQSETIFYSEAILANKDFIYINVLNKNILCINTSQKTATFIDNTEKKL